MLEAGVHTISVSERDVTVYLPAQATNAGARPLVIALHGTNGSGPNFGQSSGWVARADAEGIVVMFPSSLP